MKKFLPLNFATTGLIVIFSCIILFHLLVIFKIIPADIVWGGNLSNPREILIMETISILINMIMLLVVCVFTGVIKIEIHQAILKVAFWVMFALFILNTIGNLMSKNHLETLIFTPITILLASFCLRIAAFGFQKN